MPAGIQGVGERSVKRRRHTVRSAGADTSDTVGMSSENYSEKL
jgi:hypothetical protein